MADGAIVDGKLPPRADGLFSEAYVHEFFPPLNDVDINDLERQIDQQIPDQLKDFLQLTNGCSLFSDSLSISGFVKSPTRTRRQPISMRHGNVLERAGWLNLRPGAIRIAFYASGSGSEVFLDNDGSVRVFARRGHCHGSWNSMAHWLDAEIERMQSVYSANPLGLSPLNPIPGPLD
jgi:hypothetical protein